MTLITPLIASIREIDRVKSSSALYICDRLRHLSATVGRVRAVDGGPTRRDAVRRQNDATLSRVAPQRRPEHLGERR